MPNSDEQAIANLLYRYGFLLDAGDFDGVGRHLGDARLCADGAELDITGAEAIARHYEATTRRYPDTGTPKTKHTFSNLLIEIGPTGRTATSHANYVVFQQTEKLPLQPIIAGRYDHRYEKRGSDWRIVYKKFYVDLVGDLSHHLLFDLADAQKNDPDR